MSEQSHILVVDDEKVVLDAVQTITRAEGFDVTASMDASHALSLLEEHRYSAIVCDILMPQMDGFDFLRELGQRWIQTPVVMTTGYSTMENAVKSLYFGAIDFVSKPFTADEMLSAIRRAVRYGALIRTAGATGGLPAFIPCPSRYRRLGYASWLNQESDGIAKIGVTDLMIRTVEPIEGVELSEAGLEVIQGSACAHLKTGDDLRHGVLSPISGQIVEVNPVFDTDFSILLKDPYFESWFYRVIPSELEYEMCYLTACSSDRL
ncbi:MAG: response regulator [Bacteroidetes bacterium]|nr:response regulator [Bacteroidota bacterium]